MSPHHDEHLDLCAGYALGSLDPDDRARLERHLAEGCPVCEGALVEFSEAAVLLARSLPPDVPGSALRDRVMIAAGSTRAGAAPGDGRETTVTPEEEQPQRVIKIEPKRRVSAWPVLGWAVAAAFAVATGLLWSRTETMKTELARLQEEARWAAVMNAPGARVAVLTATPQGGPELRGRAVVDPVTRRAVLVLEGVRAPEGRDYELWAIRGAAPKALGLVKADAGGRAVMRLENVGDPETLNAFAVSLEPKGGAPTPDAPTGPVVMLGKVES